MDQKPWFFPVGNKKRFLFITRSYCHLCDDMRDQLEALRVECARGSLPGASFDVECRDVDSDVELLALYDEDVPVLLLDGRVVCRWHFDPVAVKDALTH